MGGISTTGLATREWGRGDPRSGVRDLYLRGYKSHYPDANISRGGNLWAEACLYAECMQVADAEHDHTNLTPASRPRTTVLTCANCGGPLDPPENGDRVTCWHCKRVNLIWREGEPKVEAEREPELSDNECRARVRTMRAARPFAKGELVCDTSGSVVGVAVDSVIRLSEPASVALWGSGNCSITTPFVTPLDCGTRSHLSPRTRPAATKSPGTGRRVYPRPTGALSRLRSWLSRWAAGTWA